MHENASYPYFEDVNWGLLRLWGDRSGRDILDAGCGFATTSQYLQKLGNRVVGVESSGEAVKVARTRIAEVIESDLQQFTTDRKFDAIIFADVLEHLPWPIGVLKRYTAMLKDNGSVIVSLPNVGLWTVRLGLLLGRFQYDDTGVLDRTHLRFFTRRSAMAMLAAADLHVVRRTYNPGLARPLVPLAKKILGGKEGDPGAILESAPYRLYLKTAYPVERYLARLWPGMLAFQMIFEAVRA
ncbi:MAG TPA: methyltransferase domain-containing protein [Thermoanaerobaculia bacterium]|nr:methyltransferase domain-containing protein [Thermoanaerobaculia bacterium]